MERLSCVPFMLFIARRTRARWKSCGGRIRKKMQRHKHWTKIYNKNSSLSPDDASFFFERNNDRPSTFVAIYHLKRVYNWIYNARAVSLLALAIQYPIRIKQINFTVSGLLTPVNERNDFPMWQKTAPSFSRTSFIPIAAPWNRETRDIGVSFITIRLCIVITESSVINSAQHAINSCRRPVMNNVRR